MTPLPIARTVLNFILPLTMQPPDSDNLPQVQTESKGEYCFVASLTNGGFGYRYGAYVEGHRSW